MNIPAINTLQLNSFLPLQRSKNEQNFNYGLKMTRPLSRDTVSFGAITTKEGFVYNRGISKKVASEIHNYYNQFKPQIDAIFTLLLAKLMVTSEDTNNVVEYVKSRTKSPDSIVEKSNTRNWDNKKSVMNNMTDVLGGKIVMNIGSKKAVDKVLNEFCKAINNNQIQLIEIENKVPKFLEKESFSEAEKYSYASLKSLDKLYDLQVRKHGTTPNYDKDKPFDYNDTNYTALHLLFKVPVKSIDGIKWVTTECQIMGHDVSQYKDLDDILFKALNGKNIDKKYKDIFLDVLSPIIIPQDLVNKTRAEIMKMSDDEMIENNFGKYIDIPRKQLWENIVLRKEFDAYRAETFLKQREKEPVAPKDRKIELEAFAFDTPDPKKYPNLCKKPQLYMGFLYSLKQKASK